MSSFDPVIRSTSDFRNVWAKLKRRVFKTEFAKDDLSQLQGHVNDIRASTDFANSFNTTQNDDNIGIGGAMALFEPDFNEVNAFNQFVVPYGDGVKLDQTLNAIAYDSISIPDQAGTAETCFLATPDAANDWLWVRPGSNVPPVNFPENFAYAVGLNVTDTDPQGVTRARTKQFVYYDNLGTDWDFVAQNFSIGFWIYPTDVSASGSNRIIALRSIDATSKWSVEIDNADQKLFVEVNKAATLSRRQYDTPLVANTWYFVCFTWAFATNTIVLRVNNNVDAASTKVGKTAVAGFAKPSFGNFPGGTTAQDFEGYFTNLKYYKHATVLTTTEQGNLYNYDTKFNTNTRPFYAGYSLIA